MPQLEAQICDIWGEPIAGAAILHTHEGGGLTVDEPLNDSRLAKLTLSCYDQVSKQARPLSRLLAVIYGSYLIFKGPILQAKTSYADGTVEIAAHDATLRLKHHYHTFGDYAVEIGYSVDGRGMRQLVESALPTAQQLIEDYPSNGILWGYDTSTRQPSKADGGMWRVVKPGENVWQSVQNLQQTKLDDDTGGPDFRFRPVDKDHLGKYNTTVPGFFCELDTGDRLGQDKQDEIIFEFGEGVDTLEDLIHEPDGDSVRNWFATLYPGGQRGKSDDARIGYAKNVASIKDYGFMQGWESSGQTNDTKTILQNKSRAWVKGYKRPVDHFTLTPRLDRAAGVPSYGSDFRVGDTIRARGKSGYKEIDLVGRITAAHISSVDQKGNVKVAIDCVPTVGLPGV